MKVTIILSCFQLPLLSLAKAGDTDTIPAILQYLDPPYTIPITYAGEYSSRFNDISDSLSSEVYERADFPLIFVCSFIILLIFTFICNQLSKLAYKGGIFGYL